MPQREALKLVLELDVDSESIAGRLRRADEEAWHFELDEDVWHFTGWIELTRALEEVQAEASDHQTSGGGT